MHRGFTLIELVASLLIGALLVTAAAAMYAGSQREVEMKEAIEQVMQQDAMVRSYCRNQGVPAQLLIDLSAGTMLRLGGDEGKTQGLMYELPRRYRIEQVWMLAPTSAGQKAGNLQRITSGPVTIPCSSLGLTPTYAMELQGPQGKTQWMLIAGLTGERTERMDEKEIEAIFETAQKQASRHDAD